MRRKIYDMVLATLLLLAGMPMKLCAQTASNDASSTLVYSTVDAVATATDKTYSSNTGCVYLYNVGTGEYLSFGGYWGTQPMTHEVGMPLFIDRGTASDYSGDTSNSNYYYKVGTNTNADGTNDGYLGYIRYTTNDETDTESWGQLYVDRTGKQYKDAIVRMIFTKIDNTPTYTISFKCKNNTNHDSSGDWQDVTESTTDTIYYLVAQAGDNMVVNAVKEGNSQDGTTVGSSDVYAQWRIVTRGDFIDDFALTNNQYQTQTANATFLVVDQNFNRNNTNQSVWQTSTSTNFSLSIGCGNIQVDRNQKTYGAYWLATLYGAGELYQEITCPVSGWYRLKVKGFSTGDDPAQVFIRYTTSNNVDSTSTDSLHQFTYFPVASVADSDTIMKYDKELIAANSAYQTETTVMLYISEGTTFKIGVTNYSGSGYTLIDDIQLDYAGSSYPPYILDENWTNENLINVQAKTGETRPLFLQRSLKEGRWNSLILPVSLTVSQVKEAFGGDTKVCKLDSTGRGGADIYFKSIEYTSDDYLTSNNNAVGSGVLTDNDALIKPDSLYIVWPSDLDPINTEYTYTLTENNDTIKTKITDAEKTGTLSSYFQIPLVAINNVVDSVVVDSVVTSGIDNGIYIKGSYVSGITIPKYSYAISASNGYWYYLTSGGTSTIQSTIWKDGKKTVATVASSGITSKGFRAWICTKGNATTTQTTKANLFIDAVQVTDGIEQVMQDLVKHEVVSACVYSLNGQMVNASGSLEGLPKGIYIKGGKKYVVR